MDIKTIIFMVLGFGAIIGGFLLEGGTLGGLASVSSALIIIGGTVGATGISHPKEDLKEIAKIFKVAFQSKDYDTRELITRIQGMCLKVRKDGLLSLEGQINKEEDSLMRKGLRLVVDGVASDKIRDALELSLQVMSDRHQSRALIFESAGGYSPTMGIIGTVMGLVHVLSDLNDPKSLGPKIAMAFIATLYGIGLANLLWLPIANCLNEKNKKEVLYKSAIIEGLLLMREGANPGYLEDKLSGFITDAENGKGDESKKSVESKKGKPKK